MPIECMCGFRKALGGKKEKKRKRDNSINRGN